MKKRILSMLICLVMIVSMLPVYAQAETGNWELKVIPDKTTAAPGDTINYTVYVGPVEHMFCGQFDLVVPEGLTYVENSGETVEGLAALLGAASADWTEKTHRFTFYGIGDYSSTEDTALVTFKCKVDDDAADGKYKVSLKDTYFCNDNVSYIEKVLPVRETELTVSAKQETSVDIKVTPDKTAVKVGDVVTYTVSLGKVEHLRSGQFDVVIPEGMEYVAETGKTAEGLATLLGAASADWTEKTHRFTFYGIGDYSSDADTVLVTFQCRATAIGTYKIGLDEIEFADTAFKPYDKQNVVATELTVAECSHDWTVTKEDADHYVAGTGLDCQHAKEYYYECSRCHAISKTEKFTSETKGGHTMETTWTTEGGYHFHKCSVTGCTHVEDKAACNGGTATCQKKAVCKDCNKEYGTLATHDWTKKVEDAAHLKDAGDCQTNKTYYYGCATEGCNAISTSQYFTGTTKGDHVMETTWTTEGGYHFHKCSVTGCTYVEDKAVCSGGTATCTEKAVCSTCKKEYGTTSEHEYDMANYKSDATGHWHKCKSCDATTTVEPHRPGAAATETTAQTCLDCGYVITPELGHIHTLHLTLHKAVKADCLNDGNQAYYECTCGKLFLDASALNETTLKDVTIKAPGHHNWSKKVEDADHYVEGTGLDCQHAKEYYYECSECHAISTTEKFTSTTKGNHVVETTWTTDNGYHFHKCSVAGCTYVEDKAACSGGTATCQKKAVCKDCNKEYGTLAAHDWTKKVEDAAHLKDAGDCQTNKTYYYGCATEGCNAISISQYFTGTTKGDHVMETTWTTEGGYHFHKCSVTGCTYVEDKAACSGGTATCTEKAVCSTCKKEYGTTSEHEYDMENYKSDATGHWHKCKNCDATTTVEPHRPGAAATETTAQTCLDCSYVITPELGHIHTLHLTLHKAVKADCLNDGNQAYYECTCGKLFLDASALKETTLKDVTIKAPGHHNWSKKVEDADHYVEGTGLDCQHAKEYYYECSECTAKSTTETFKSTEKGPHFVDTTKWVSDGKSHYHACTVTGCDYREDVTTCSGGTATCEAKAICEGCQHEYGSLAPHVDENGDEICDVCNEQLEKHNVNPTWQYNEYEHWRDCSAGDRHQLTAHMDENNSGRCDVCSYVMNAAAVETAGATSPQTGDNSMLLLWCVLGISSACALVCKRRKNA